jgi:hypothetical protein
MREPETAFYECAFRGFIALIVSAVLMACYSADAAGALRIAAHVALLYAVFTMALAEPRREPSRQGVAAGLHATLPDRPANVQPDRIMLYFAEGGTLVAIALSVAAASV